MKNRSECSVYLLYDPSTRIVRYVGISSDPEKRFYEHKGHPGFDGYFLFKWFADRIEAQKVEIAIIHKYQPQLLNNGNTSLIDGLRLYEFVSELDELEY